MIKFSIDNGHELYINCYIQYEKEFEFALSHLEEYLKISATVNKPDITFYITFKNEELLKEADGDLIETFPGNRYYRSCIEDTVLLTHSSLSHSIQVHHESPNSIHAIIRTTNTSIKTESIFLRLYRDVLQRNLHDKNYLLSHMACVGIHNSYIGIMGNKGEGKSGILMKLLSLKFNYLANDRVFLHPEKGCVITYPIAAMISKESLNDAPQSLNQKILSSKIIRKDHLIKGYNKIGLTPLELVKSFDVRMEIHGKLIAIIILKRSKNNQATTLRPATHAEIDEVLMDNIYAKKDPTYKFNWIYPQDTSNEEPRFDELSKSFKYYLLEYSFDNMPNSFLKNLFKILS